MAARWAINTCFIGKMKLNWPHQMISLSLSLSRSIWQVLLDRQAQTKCFIDMASRANIIMTYFVAVRQKPHIFIFEIVVYV